MTRKVHEINLHLRCNCHLNLIKVCATQSCISDISKSNQNHHTSHLLPCTVLTRGDVRDLHKPLYGLHTTIKNI